MPQGEDVECLVMVGVNEEHKAVWEVLKWDNEKKAFIWWTEEYKQNCLYPADNFTLWADLNDLIDIKELNEILAKNSKEKSGHFKLIKSE